MGSVFNKSLLSKGVTKGLMYYNWFQLFMRLYDALLSALIILL